MLEAQLATVVGGPEAAHENQKQKQIRSVNDVNVNLWLPLFLAISDQVSLPRYMSVQNTLMYRNA